MDNKIKKELVEISKLMDDKGFVNTFEGNLSIKKDTLLYITPSGKRKASLTQDMIAVLDEDNKQIEGDFKPSSELIMHTNTYKIRNSISAVIHAHTPFLTAHAICNKPIECKSYCEMIAVFKKIDVAPFGRPGTEEIFKYVPQYLSSSNIVLLANHGVLAVGKSIEDTYNIIETAEAIAKVLTLTKLVGKQVDIEEEEYNYLYNL